MAWLHFTPLERFIRIPDERFRVPALAMLAILALMFALMGCAGMEERRETPRVVQVEVAPGRFLAVAVYAHACYKDHTGGRANLDSPGAPSVFLCHHPEDEPHELAHWKGMRHTAWEEGPVSACSWVLAAGYKTRYHAGDRLCMTRESRYEWIETGGK